MTKSFLTLCTSVFIAQALQAQIPIIDTTSVSAPIEASKPVAIAEPAKPKAPEVKKKWFELLQIRGYVQTRYNRFFETNDQVKCESCDRSIGEGGGISVRRGRMIVSGNVHERVFAYIQFDYANDVGTSSNYMQIRDAYADIGIDKKNEFRFRIGNSKVPYGFENMQSSQNRIPIDRADALNSGAPGERDLGLFFYWAPEKKRQLFTSLIADGLKGSGDYGVFALGVYNGQSANKPDLNKNKHTVIRFTYPFKYKNQIFEPGIQAYTGKYQIATDRRSTGIKGNTKDNWQYLDRRIAATFVLYPKPFGILAEYNVGKGPRYDKTKDSIITDNLTGGFITANYLFKYKHNVFMPYVRYQYYDGGRKNELDARSLEVRETEIGIEWQPFKAFELTAAYTISDRRFEDFAKKNNRQKGNFLRLQAQFNF
jgi:hypothetical protein